MPDDDAAPADISAFTIAAAPPLLAITIITLPPEAFARAMLFVATRADISLTRHFCALPIIDERCRYYRTRRVFATRYAMNSSLRCLYVAADTALTIDDVFIMPLMLFHFYLPLFCCALFH